MPTYEFKCLSCGKMFNIFATFADYNIESVVCTHCGSKDVQRKIGRIRVARSDEERLENLADPSMLDGVDDDPRALAKMMKSMGEEMGEDLGAEFEEVVDRLEKGQAPEDIEKAMPDLGNDLQDA